MKKIITIFGSTGNLMYKKLFPALSSLVEKNFLNKDTKIYLVARRDCTLDDYIEEAKNEMTVSIDWPKIIPYLTYVKLDINDLEDYHMLNEMINQNSGELDKIFYLAVPPQLFPNIAKGISESGLIKKGDENRF